jgi:hypothetical protein
MEMSSKKTSETMSNANQLFALKWNENDKNNLHQKYLQMNVYLALEKADNDRDYKATKQISLGGDKARYNLLMKHIDMTTHVFGEWNYTEARKTELLSVYSGNEIYEDLQLIFIPFQILRICLSDEKISEKDDGAIVIKKKQFENIINHVNIKYLMKNKMEIKQLKNEFQFTLKKHGNKFLGLSFNKIDVDDWEFVADDR